MNSTDLRLLARGQEERLIAALLTTEQMNGKHQPCPKCGGTDRFRYDKKSNNFYCGGGGDTQSGDWLNLAYHIYDKGAFAWAKEKLDVASMTSAERQRHERDILAVEARKAKEARAKTLRTQYDSNLVDTMFELETMITRRRYESNPTKDEIALATDLIADLKKRYRID